MTCVEIIPVEEVGVTYIDYVIEFKYVTEEGEVRTHPSATVTLHLYNIYKDLYAVYVEDDVGIYVGEDMFGCPRLTFACYAKISREIDEEVARELFEKIKPILEEIGGITIENWSLKEIRK